MPQELPVQRILELACAAERTNRGYLKESESVFDNEGKFLFVKHSNKGLIRWASGLDRTNQAPEFSQLIFLSKTAIKKWQRVFGNILND